MNSENSLYRVQSQPFKNDLRLPSSKSHSNRALIIGALRGKNFTVENLSTSTDVVTLLACLEKVGLKISKKDSTIIFLNSFPDCESDTLQEIIDLQTGDGGTTNRFLLALLSLGKKTYRFFPTEKISERPILDLINPLKKLDVEIKTESDVRLDKAWISIKGPAQFSLQQPLEINCSKSTQFASALKLAFCQKSIQFEFKNIKASETYLKMTDFVLAETKNRNIFYVPVDFSSLSYPLALAIVEGQVLIENCHEVDPTQSDSKFIALIEKMGGDISFSTNGLRASSKNKLTPFEVDISEFPDLAPTLAFLASRIEGESILHHLEILRFKESDRLEEIIKILKLFQVDFDYNSQADELKITGSFKKILPINVSTARDHRIVMTAYLFLHANSGGGLSHSDCVDKSFPGFFKVMQSSL